MNTPAIFIHGFYGSLDFLPHRREDFAPELLGYGIYDATPVDKVSISSQVEHLHALLEARFGSQTVDLVGHSVGGIIAMLFAYTYPGRVRRIVNVEGNFTLADAFWTASVGRMRLPEAEAMLDELRSDPHTWIKGAVGNPTPAIIQIATGWLDNQPASTLRAMGQSVVATTGSPDYLANLEKVFERHPVYLLSGSNSRGSWNLPGWALEKCAGDKILDNCGHLMMLEDPGAFLATVYRYLAD